MLDDTDMTHLRRCVALASEALDHGDEPFGSVLVGADGEVLAEDRNRIAGGDATRHPEFASRAGPRNTFPRRLGPLPPSIPQANTARCALPPMPGWGLGASSTPVPRRSSPPG